MTLSFYYNPEFFTDHGEGIQLDKAGNTCKCIKHFKANSVYGNIKINKKMYCNKFIWDFKILNANKDVVVAIGLDSSDKHYPDTLFDNGIFNSNSFYSFESIYRDGISRIQRVGSTGDKYGHCYSDPDKQDVVTMELDTNKETLKYYLNGDDQGIAVDNISFDDDEEYIAAISMNCEIEIQLLRFEQRHEK